MSPPFAPVREAIRRPANGLTSVELSCTRYVELPCELSELFVGNWPSLMRRLGQALIETPPPVVGSELEVAHHD